MYFFYVFGVLGHFQYILECQNSNRTYHIIGLVHLYIPQMNVYILYIDVLIVHTTYINCTRAHIYIFQTHICMRRRLIEFVRISHRLPSGRQWWYCTQKMDCFHTSETIQPASAHNPFFSLGIQYILYVQDVCMAMARVYSPSNNLLHRFNQRLFREWKEFYYFFYYYLFIYYIYSFIYFFETYQKNVQTFKGEQSVSKTIFYDPLVNG